MDTGVAQFYYTRQLPDGAVPIAQVKADPFYAQDLIDVSNFISGGSLGIWRYSLDGTGPVDDLTQPAHWTAVGLNIPITISGSLDYVFDSQFFELTNVWTDGGTPLFYKHKLDSEANSITITDDSGKVVVTDQVVIQNGYLYHSLDGSLYWIRYVNRFGILQKELLKYDYVIKQAPIFADSNSYAVSGRTISVGSTSAVSVRFTSFSTFKVSIPYGNLPNVPWFPRIRFPLTSLIPEWAAQTFNPTRPYLLASWITGTVVNPHVIELQRKDVYPDTDHWPDILVFDKNYVIKYAYEGTSPDVASRRGSAYPWKRGQIKDVDFHTGRVQILGDLEPDDIVFGFYSYLERDVILNAIDCNPFTNPSIRNCIVRCYYRTDSDTFKRLFYQVIDFNGSDVPGLTNDSNPVNGDWDNVSLTKIGDLFVGASVSPKNLTVTDARVRGGGLIESSQDIAQAAHFWDIGYIDGKPYPVGGTLAVYLPSSILNVMSRSEVKQRVNKVLPLGTLCVVRYYDSNFQEVV